MKMIKCKECGEQIQSNVEFCPNCGCPIKNKRKIKNAAICIGTILIFCTAAISSFYFVKNTKDSNQFANDSISKDSVMRTSDTEHTKVTVDPSLVRTGDMGYSFCEEENGREVRGGINMMYNVDSTQTYQGSMRYYPTKGDYENDRRSR